MECADEDKSKRCKESGATLPDGKMADNVFPYSYHTFMFPFQWKYSDTDLNAEKSDSEDLFKFLDNDSYWESNKSPLFGDEQTCNTWEQKERARRDYSMYQYFNVPARKVIFSDLDDKDVKKKVHNYIYKFADKKQSEKDDKKDSSSRIYSIKIRSTDDDNAVDDHSADHSQDYTDADEKKGEEYTEYDLNIRNITMRLYDPIGIGVIVYELENYNYRSMKAVIQINEYGRRIQLAMMAPEAKGKKYLTAASLRIKGALPHDIEQNFEAEVIDHTSSGDKFPWDKNKLNTVSHTVSDLFMDRYNNKKVSFDKKEEDDIYYFMPYVDDRMFCMSLISDPQICQGKGFTNIDSLGDEEWLKRLYEFVFIDPYKGCTCQNLPMCKEMLAKALYLRWVDYGTIYGINRYSMVAITGEHQMVGDSVIQPFLTMYKEIVQLVLVQRAAISMFAERAMEISRIASQNKLIKNYMLELQQDYVSFKNQILLFEVTAQQQGIEIYDMVRDSMNIKQQKDEMEEQFHNLFEISEMQSNDSTNAVLHTFTIFGLLFVGLQIIQQQFSVSPGLNAVLVTLFGLGFIAFIWYLRSHLRAPRKIEGKSKLEYITMGLATFFILLLIVASFIDFKL